MADLLSLDERRAARDRAEALSELGDDARLADWLAGEPRRRRLRPKVAAVLALSLDGWEPWEGLDVAARGTLAQRIADRLDDYRTFRGGVSTAADAGRVVAARLDGLPEPLGLRLAAALLQAATVAQRIADASKPNDSG